MTASVTVGEFSRLTHLSVKTLHHYHDIGLLAPAAVDPSSGYRRYRTTQVGTALLIRRLRELQMPLAQVRDVVEAPDPAARDRALRDHLIQMEAELAHTREVVASLRSMLAGPAPLQVDYRDIPAARVFTITDQVDRAVIGPWCEVSFPALYAAAAGRRISGPGAATYSDAFFEQDAGEVVAYVPVAAGAPAARSGVEVAELPAGRFAVAVHAGALTDFDRTYGALGSHVAEHCTMAPRPIREIYVVGPGDVEDPAEFRTEVCWPIEPEENK